MSAALVLIGVNLISSELARHGNGYEQLGVAAVAEVYAWTLIAAAAWLMRVGFRRPAVILALIVALHQGDVTLHTETSLRKPSIARRTIDSSEHGSPYRAALAGDVAAQSWQPNVTFGRAKHRASVRLVLGALVGVYLSIWTTRWSGGPGRRIRSRSICC